MSTLFFAIFLLVFGVGFIAFFTGGYALSRILRGRGLRRGFHENPLFDPAHMNHQSHPTGQPHSSGHQDASRQPGNDSHGHHHHHHHSGSPTEAAHHQHTQPTFHSPPSPPMDTGSHGGGHHHH